MILKLIPLSLKIFLKDLFKSVSQDEKELEKLKKLERYREGSATLNGISFHFPDNASFVFNYKEIFNQEVYFFDSDKSDPLIIDGGANIGLAVNYFKKRFPSGRVIAFEPDPEIFRYLTKNTEGLEGVELVQKGLWSVEDTLTFEEEGADAGRLDDKGTKSVEVTRLSPYLNNQVDYLKLDIEGAEFEVLCEIKDKLINVERIFVEYHNFTSRPQRLSELLEMLKSSGFKYFISSPGLSNHPFKGVKLYNGMDFQVNIFAFKES